MDEYAGVSGKMRNIKNSLVTVIFIRLFLSGTAHLRNAFQEFS